MGPSPSKENGRQVTRYWQSARSRAYPDPEIIYGNCLVADCFREQLEVCDAIAIGVALDGPGAVCGIKLGAKFTGCVGEHAIANECERIVGVGALNGIDQ